MYQKGIQAERAEWAALPAIDRSCAFLAKGRRTYNGKGGIEVSGLTTLRDAAAFIADDEGLRRQTEEVREVLAATGRSEEYDRAKAGLLALIPSLAIPQYGGIDAASLRIGAWHTGLYGYDLDEGRPVDIPEMRGDLRRTSGMAMVGVSCGGDALYCIMAGPRARNEGEHKAYWTALSRKLPGAARAASSAVSKNPSRLRYAAYDPAVWVNPDCLVWAVEELMTDEVAAAVSATSRML